MISNLNIIYTNIIQCTREWSWDSDENGWAGYHIWCVDKGGAQIKSDGATYHLFPGDIFLFNFNYRYLCTHDPENPLHVTTVYFTGNLPDLKNKFIPQAPALCHAVHQVVNSKLFAHDLDLAHMWLYPVVAEIVKGPQKKKEFHEKVQAALAFLEERNFRNFTLDELSANVGYSKNQLLRIFKQDIGQTPVQYCLSKRIEQAKSMILYSSMTITEISCSLGFYDISYFTRLFKQHTGYSPSHYKKQPFYN